MKKRVSVLFCFVLLMALLTGCGNSAKNDVMPGDTDVNRPEINDNVNDNTTNDTNHNNTLGDDIDKGVSDVGDAVDKGVDDVTDMVENGVDRMTGNK